jgi:hypothetical protein
MNLVVNKTEGPYYKIQDAVNKATPGSIIRIASGMFSENIIIHHNNLTI